MTRGTEIAQAVNHARDLINEPAAAITPVALAGDAQAIAPRAGSAGCHASRGSADLARKAPIVDSHGSYL